MAQTQSKPKLVLPHEKTPLILLSLIFVLFRAGLEISGNFAEVIYFRRVGVENLPQLYSAEPLAMVFVLVIFSLIADRINRHQLLLILNLTFAAALIAARFLILLADWQPIYFILYICQRIFFALLPLTFWLLCSDLFDIRQAKRLFVLITASGLVGILLGNLLTGLLSGIFAPEEILALTSGFFVASLGVGAWLSRRSLPKSFVKPKVSTDASFSPVLPLDILKQPFIQFFALLILITGILEPVWRYELNAIADQSFAAESSLIAFYGYFKGAAVLVVVIFQLFLAGRLIEIMGVPWAISTHPLGLVGIMLLLGFYPVLWMAVASVALIGVVRVGLDESGRKAIVGIYPQHERARASTFERQMTYLGIFLGGLFLIWAVDHLSLAQINWIAAAFASTWIIAFPRFRAQYAQACLRRGRSPLDDADLPQSARQRGTRTLSNRSNSNAASLIADQLECADQLAAWRSIPHVQKLIAEQRAAAARSCLFLLESLYPAGDMRVAARLLRSPASDVRANGLEALDIILRRPQKNRLMMLFESAFVEGDEQREDLPEAELVTFFGEMSLSLDPEAAFWGKVWRLRSGEGEYAPPGYGIPAELTVPLAAAIYPKTGGEAMELADKIDALRASDAFAALSEAELRIIALCAREAYYPPDEVIFEEGQQGHALYIILDGHVELASVEEKKSLQALGPGGVFGEHALFTEERYPLTAVTISDSRMLILEREMFLELIQYYPNIALSLLKNLAKRFEKATALLQKVWV